MRLIPILDDATPAAAIDALPPVAREVLDATAQMYASVGYSPPWVGYLAIVEGHCVGTCSFKGPPRGGSVELAYFTFPGHESRGVATGMARELIRIARNASPHVVITAQTLPERNASNAILAKLGFTFAGEVRHPEDGRVWEWRLEGPERWARGAEPAP